MRFDRNKQQPTPRMYLKPSAFQSHQQKARKQIKLYMSVFFCVILWLIIHVQLGILISFNMIQAIQFYIVNQAAGSTEK